MRRDHPLAINLPQSQALVLGLHQAPAHGTPDLLLPFPVSPPPSAPRRGLLMWSMDDVGRDFPKKRVCFVPGRRAQRALPRARASPFSSPKLERDITATSPCHRALSLLHHRPLQKRGCAGSESKKKSTGHGFVVPTNLGVASVSMSPPVLHEDELPAGSALCPQEVPWCQLGPAGTAALSTRTGPGTSSRTPGWSGFGADRKRL